MILPSKPSVPTPTPRPGLLPQVGNPIPRPVPMIERSILSTYGDYTYEPDVDWSAHRMSAKLDTLLVDLYFDESIDLNTVYARINNAIGRPHKAGQGVDVKGTIPGIKFVLRLQDPLPADVVRLTHLPGLVRSDVNQIDVALDLHDFKNDDELERATAALALVYSAPDIKLSDEGGQRCTYPISHEESLTRRLAVEPLLARHSQTIYFGKRRADLMARIYLKLKDKRTELPFEQRVARHELEIRSKTLRSMGVINLEDLVHFDFRKVQKFFKYETLVVREPSGKDVVACAKAKANQLMRKKAANAGVALVTTDRGEPKRIRVRSGDQTSQRTLGRRRVTVAHKKLNDRARQTWNRFADDWTKGCAVNSDRIHP